MLALYLIYNEDVPSSDGIMSSDDVDLRSIKCKIVQIGDDMMTHCIELLVHFSL